MLGSGANVNTYIRLYIHALINRKIRKFLDKFFQKKAKKGILIYYFKNLPTAQKILSKYVRIKLFGEVEKNKFGQLKRR